MKIIFLTTLALCATVGLQTSVFARSEIAPLPENLVLAETLDEQDAVTEESLVDDEGLALEALRPGHGRGRHPNPGHGGYRPHPRPGHGRYRPHPLPRPYPRPYPPVRYPRPRPVVRCYAQSPANGVTYSATAYYATDAQNAALDECYRFTGYQCVARGCY